MNNVLSIVSEDPRAYAEMGANLESQTKVQVLLTVYGEVRVAELRNAYVASPRYCLKAFPVR